MKKHRMQPGWGLAAGALFGLITGTCVCVTIGGDHSEQAALEIIGWFFLGGAMAGVALGLKFNPTVSVYWPWLVVVFGIGFAQAFGRMMAGYYQTPPGLRDDALYNYAPFLVCALIATAIAMTAAIAHHAKRLKRGEKDDASNFSIATILLVLGGASVVFGLLRWIDAPAAFFYIVVICILGRFACLLVNAEITRRRYSLSNRTATSENGQSGKDLPENTPD
jgi:hypothetical protein